MLAVGKEILAREKRRYLPIIPLVVLSPGGVGFQLTSTWRLSDYYIFYLFDRERLKPLNPGKRRSIPLEFPNFQAGVTLT